MGEWKTYRELIEDYEESLRMLDEVLAKPTCSFTEEHFLQIQRVDLINAIAAMMPYAEREEESKCRY